MALSEWYQIFSHQLQGQALTSALWERKNREGEEMVQLDTE